MKRYRVDLKRDAYQCYEVYVRAESAEAAENFVFINQDFMDWQDAGLQVFDDQIIEAVADDWPTPCEDENSES